jgi:pimeloyl-ACP methyl ester carboxylesterase
VACFQHNGHDVHFDVQGEGPALLFMHGLAADRRQATQALGGSDGLIGYRLISLDMPGHGDSLLPAGSDIAGVAGFAAYTDVALALLEHLEVRKVIAGGISMGAGIALHLALSRPDLVEALLLVRPAWLDAPGRPHLDVIGDIGKWIEEAGVDAAAEKLADHPVYLTALRDNPACAASVMGATTRPQAVAAAAVLDLLVSDRPFARMGALQNCPVPALVVGNNADPLHPPLIAREIAGALPSGRYFHAPPKYLEPEEHRLAIINSIRDFLQNCLSGRPAA